MRIRMWAMGHALRAPWRVVLGVGLAAILSLACGSDGGGSDSTGAPAAVTTVESEGPIAGFGSVIMNGVRWETDDAEFEIDGRRGRQDDLEVGMVVVVEGERRADGRAWARRIRFDARLRGPVRVIEPISRNVKTLEIFGLPVLVSRGGTRFARVTYDTLALDTMLEVSGLLNGDGELVATHVKRRDDPVIGESEVKLFGAIDGLAGGSFVLGTSEVLFGDRTQIDDDCRRRLRDGQRVRVEGILLANDAVRATEIECPRRFRPDDVDERELQGLVSNFVSIAEFDVAGHPVDASGARFLPNDPDLLRDGVLVEVEGRVSDEGVLIAKKVKFRSHRVRIHAEIADDTDVDRENRRLWLLGIPIDVHGVVRLRDQARRVPDFDVPHIGAGDFLEVRGFARADGSVIATRIERERPDDVRLRGPLDSVDAESRTLTILGVEVPTDGGTEFEIEDGGPIDPDRFFGAAQPGWLVDVRDRMDGDETAIDVADRVELIRPELEDDDEDQDDDDESDSGDDEPGDGSVDD